MESRVCIEDPDSSLVIVGALNHTVRQKKSSSVRFASSQLKMHRTHTPASDVINDTDEDVDDEIKIELENESFQ